MTAVTIHKLTLDGRRTYSISPKLASFSTTNLQTVSLLSRQDQYVQVGLKGSTVVWIAGIAGVVPGQHSVVYYRGKLARVDRSNNAIFEDGTVLRLATALRPAVGSRLLVTIDPATHRVTDLTQQ